MPKCLDCGNTSEFISFYRDVTVEKYDETGNEIDSYSVGYDPTGEEEQCSPCGSTNIDWVSNPLEPALADKPPVTELDGVS